MVIDSSPITIVPDSLPMLGQVSGVLVVMRESKTTMDGARMLRDQFGHLGISPLGLVMNRTPPTDIAGAYGYYLYAPSSDNGADADNGRRPSRRERARLKAANDQS